MCSQNSWLHADDNNNNSQKKKNNNNQKKKKNCESSALCPSA